MNFFFDWISKKWEFIMHFFYKQTGCNKKNTKKIISSITDCLLSTSESSASRHSVGLYLSVTWNYISHRTQSLELIISIPSRINHCHTISSSKNHHQATSCSVLPSGPLFSDTGTTITGTDSRDKNVKIT